MSLVVASKSYVNAQRDAAIAAAVADAAGKYRSRDEPVFVHGGQFETTAATTDAKKTLINSRPAFQLLGAAVADVSISVSLVRGATGGIALPGHWNHFTPILEWSVGGSADATKNWKWRLEYTPGTALGSVVGNPSIQGSNTLTAAPGTLGALQRMDIAIAAGMPGASLPVPNDFVTGGVASFRFYRFKTDVQDTFLGNINVFGFWMVKVD